jgi:hypothetical protein
VTRTVPTERPVPVPGPHGAADRSQAVSEARIGLSWTTCSGPSCSPRRYVANPRRFCSSDCLHDALVEVDPRFADTRLIGVGMPGA